MPNFYIYTSSYNKENEQQEIVPCSVTVIFCDRDTIEDLNLQNEIKVFYEANYQTDEIFVIGGEYSEVLLEKLFIKDQLTTFKDIPRLQREHLSDTLFLFTFNKDGKLKCVNKPGTITKEILAIVINDGLINIFKERGGLIEAKGNAHHFVFPSGKHCNKFLRTGNILLHSSEIYFIAFTLLSRYKEDEHKQIYCDTSSINTLAFALLELKRKLVGETFKIIPVESFSSYSGIFSKSIRFFGNSLILISSSTSGNIIEKLIKHDQTIDIGNLVILYFLGSDKDYLRNRPNIICNLTKSHTNMFGLNHYDTYTERDCIYCKSGSYAVEVKGDVFLLEKPKINRVTINVTDAPKRMSNFINQFKAKATINNTVLKVNYKETIVVKNKYEVYFDMHHVLCEIEKDTTGKIYREYREKLFNYINQYIPSNAKYFITLPDEGSEKLAEIITNHIRPNYKDGKLPEIVKFDDVGEKIKDEKAEGAVVIIGSCVSNGKNLLYLSRTLRPFDKLRLVYFIGLTRTNNEEYLNSLKRNLKQGLYGKESNSFVDVDNFYCNKDSKHTSWLKEKDFITELVDALDEQLPGAVAYFKARIAIIDESLSTKEKGLANALFYPNTENEELELRKGFAFFNFTNYTKEVSQADVYFTMSAVINQLRNSDDYKHCLKQTEFVRNMLDPHNFNRFNDGIIQACILRGALPSELSYHIDEELSNDMKGILEKIIDQHRTPQGEGLIEFLYAISIEKLTLRKEHLTELSQKLESITDNELVSAFNWFIKKNILSDKPTMQEQIEKLKKEIVELKNAK